MFWIGLVMATGALFGLSGRVRLFITVFGCVTLLLVGHAVYTHYFIVLPNMEMGGSDDGTRIGFALAMAFEAVAWVATLFAFCFGFLINAFLRWMDWL